MRNRGYLDLIPYYLYVSFKGNPPELVSYSGVKYSNPQQHSENVYRYTVVQNYNTTR